MASETLPLHLGMAFLSALVVALVGTFLVRGWARRRGYLDYPDAERRMHREPTPNVGGVAVALGATLVFMCWALFLVPEEFRRPEIGTMLFGGLAMLFVGFRDDVSSLRPRVKFALQFLIATAVFLGGVRIQGGHFLVWAGSFSLLVSFLVTTAWIVGTTNAFNLIDGSDGVAAGAALFASASLGLAFLVQGDPLGALMAAVLVGSSLGFLFFNFPPASIFMGDSGSLFLGYTLATLGIITTNKTSALLAVAIPVAAFGVPFLDTGIAIVRRFLRREPIFAADRGHIHHRLRDLGHTPRGVALTLYLACAGFAALSMLLATGETGAVLPIFAVLAVILVVGVQRLNVPELIELRHVVGRGLKQRWVIAHNIRVNAATDALRRARDPAAILEGLELAFVGSEFHRLEMWVPEYLGSALYATRTESVFEEAGGVRLSMHFGAPTEAEIEVRVPVVWKGRRVGRFSLIREAEGERLFTDLRLFPRVLIPALVGALERMSVPEAGVLSTAARADAADHLLVGGRQSA